MPKRRATGSTPGDILALHQHAPASGVSNPASSRSVVVLPLPLGPSSASISPRSSDERDVGRPRGRVESLDEPLEPEESVTAALAPVPRTCRSQ